MSASPRARQGQDTLHPLAKLLSFLFAPRAGLFALIALGCALVIGFGVEALMTGGQGWSKYPDVLGGYEVLPIVALAGAILLGWGVRFCFGVKPDFYARAAGDEIEEHGDA